MLFSLLFILFFDFYHVLSKKACPAYKATMEKWALDNLDKITEKDYQIIYQNKVVTEFAKRFGLKYEMEDLKDAED